MTSSEDEAMRLLRTWIKGNTPVRFSLSTASFITARGVVTISPETDETAIVLVGKGDLRLTFLSEFVTSVGVDRLPNGYPNLKVCFGEAILLLAEARS